MWRDPDIGVVIWLALTIPVYELGVWPWASQAGDTMTTRDTQRAIMKAPRAEATNLLDTTVTFSR